MVNESDYVDLIILFTILFFDIFSVVQSISSGFTCIETFTKKPITEFKTPDNALNFLTYNSTNHTYNLIMDNEEDSADYIESIVNLVERLDITDTI